MADQRSVPTANAAPRGKKRPMTAGATKTLDGAKSRDHEVMNAAIQLFWDKGYAATSVQDVADAVGMLKGSLYYYIDGKEDLLKRIFQDSHAEVSTIAERVRTSDAKAIDRLTLFLEEYALWYVTHVKRASLYAREWRHAGPALRSVLIEQRQYYDQVLQGMITDAQQDGDLDPDLDARMATFYIMSAISSLPDWYRPGKAKQAESVAHAYAELSLRLLRHAA
ncbi:TetR/AcrR family transcriptional regulator [Nocardioides sp.]|jgi:AcrR family transcriptional regulator|uniref:TetR/AcrR family transcriptional regulator n=1 Tax=Nocardioides sp. TaxID=35761 RepID=UPI0031FF3AA1|nr:TetR/AcrR family transcriptional regulator [Nocardioides sp.]